VRVYEYKETGTVSMSVATTREGEVVTTAASLGVQKVL
jgi:hypothetical protein